MKYHYFAFVSWHIVNHTCSVFNPPPHTVKSDQHVGRRCTGGRWIPAQVKGYRVHLNVALPGVAEEISILVGAFFKVRLRVFTRTLQTHPDPLFLCWNPINQLPERKTPWPGLILSGQGEPTWKAWGVQAPPFQIYCVCRALVVLGNRRVCRLVSVNLKTSGRIRVLLRLTAAPALTAMTLWR